MTLSIRRRTPASGERREMDALFRPEHDLGWFTWDEALGSGRTNREADANRDDAGGPV